MSRYSEWNCLRACQIRYEWKYQGGLNPYSIVVKLMTYRKYGNVMTRTLAIILHSSRSSKQKKVCLKNKRWQRRVSSGCGGNPHSGWRDVMNLIEVWKWPVWLCDVIWTIKRKSWVWALPKPMNKLYKNITTCLFDQYSRLVKSFECSKWELIDWIV